MTSRHAGFTVIELMITVALLAILLGIAAPSVRDLTLNARMTSLTNDLMTDLAIARAEAVKRGVRAAVCASSSGADCTNSAWNQGWIVFVDPDGDGAVGAAADIIKAVAALDASSTITSTGHASSGAGGPMVMFRPSGVIAAGGAGVVRFDLCDTRTTANVGAAAAQNRGRRITVSGTGRAVANRITCP
jgi:type IV fimbrial biogenesis protein FimT